MGAMVNRLIVIAVNSSHRTISVIVFILMRILVYIVFIVTSPSPYITIAQITINGKLILYHLNHVKSAMTLAPELYNTLLCSGSSSLVIIRSLLARLSSLL